MARAELEQLWNDQRNWRRYGWAKFYICKEDPRVVVPKPRRWMGWTVNFAHPGKAAAVVATAVVLAVGPTLAAITAGMWEPGRLSLVILGSVLAVTLYGWILARSGG